MRITVLGANGRIGKCLVLEALRRGYEVTAYVRKMNSVDINHQNLSVVIGELTDAKQLKEAINGRDAVVSAVGPKLSMKRNVIDLPISEGHEVIIQVMKECAVKRFITLGTPTVRSKEDVKQLATILPGAMAKILFPTGYAEMKNIEVLIKNSDLDWTIVRIINPNSKKDGRGYAVTFGDEKSNLSVSPNNAGHCMVDAIEKDEWIHKMPIVFNK